MGRQLADEDRTCLGELARDRRIPLRHVIEQQAGMRRGADAGGLVDVLQRERNAVERAARAPRLARAIGGAGGAPCRLRGGEGGGVWGGGVGGGPRPRNLGPGCGGGWPRG